MRCLSDARKPNLFPPFLFLRIFCVLLVLLALPEGSRFEAFLLLFFGWRLISLTLLLLLYHQFVSEFFRKNPLRLCGECAPEYVYPFLSALFQVVKLLQCGCLRAGFEMPSSF